MRLVIDIPEKFYITIKECKDIWNQEPKSIVYTAIANGIPLPKGHGNLIDRNKIEYLKAIHNAKFGDISWSDAIKKIKESEE